LTINPLRVRFQIAAILSILILIPAPFISLLLEPVLSGISWIASVVGMLLAAVFGRSIFVKLVLGESDIRIVNLTRSVSIPWSEIEAIEARPIRMTAADDRCLHFVLKNGESIASLATLWPGRAGADRTILGLERFGKAGIHRRFLRPDRGAGRAGNGWRPSDPDERNHANRRD
jgi:hypothetical protein